MTLRKSFRKWFSSRPAPARKRKDRAQRGPTARPKLEHLEDRIAPAAALLFNGVLFVQGDTNQNDFFTLRLDNTGTQVEVTVQNNSGSFGFGPFALANINQINVEAFGNGNNTLTVDSSNGLIPRQIQ